MISVSGEPARSFDMDGLSGRIYTETNLCAAIVELRPVSAVGRKASAVRHALIWLRVLPEYRNSNPWNRRWIKPWQDPQRGTAERVAFLAWARATGREPLCPAGGMSWPELVRDCERRLGYKGRPWYVHRWFRS